MRIPLYVATIFAALVVGGTWWFYTREIDFITPPSPERLAILAQANGSAIPPRVISILAPPKPGPVEDLPIPSNTPQEEPAVAISLGDLTAAPLLDAYTDRAADGADKMVELASLLETNSHPQRALLAWERVLDTCASPAPGQVAAAVAAIKRLSPTLPPWNADLAKAKTIVIHAGTDQKVAKDLKPVLEQMARNLQTASSGLLIISSAIAVGPRADRALAVPVALWFTGGGKSTASTDVLAFTLDASEKLNAEVQQTALTLLSTYLKRKGLQAPAFTQVTENPATVVSIESHITRLGWEKIGSQLNQPAPIQPATASPPKKPEPKPARKPRPKPAAKPAKKPVLVYPNVRR